MDRSKKDLPKKSVDISEWYNKVILLSEMADYGPAKGTMIYRPWGYAIWELVQKYMDEKIKEKGVENAYFPLFIPESLLKKEKDHVEGFAPELAVVTIGGGEELAERLVVRPTSETIMYASYANWIHSYRDLPVLINQWNNVVRWEKRTYLFMRGSEFLWQEGHTAHSTHEESWGMVKWAIDMYAKTYHELFAMSGYVGRKSESEKFAGADTTTTFESLMPGGKALQACTSHDLGQNFSKPFDIKFLDNKGLLQNVWQTSWGFSTRSIGGLVMAHGDDAGLVLPPKLAPIQVVVLPVKPDNAQLMDVCSRLTKQIGELGIRVKMDARDDESFGFRINKWELKGVPIRVEVGPKEMDVEELTIAIRFNGEKRKIAHFRELPKLLDWIQSEMHVKQVKFTQENTREAKNWEEFKEIMNTHKGFIKAYWDETPETEAKIKEETKATTRCLVFDEPEGQGVCVYSGKPAKRKWLFAQAY